MNGILVNEVPLEELWASSAGALHFVENSEILDVGEKEIT